MTVTTETGGFVGASVIGAPRVPRPYGLFSVVSFRRESLDRWEIGAQWESLPGDPARGTSDECLPEANVDPGWPLDLESVKNLISKAKPFDVYGSFSCNPVGWSAADAQVRANAHLVAREEQRVEQALWSGDLGNTPNFNGANSYTAPTVIDGSAMSLVERLAAAEGFIADTYGSLGVIHLGLVEASKLRVEARAFAQGGRLYTSLGTPIVVGSGYDNDAIVGTPALLGYQSEVFDVPAVFERKQNVMTALAMRKYLIGFDDVGVVRVTF